MLVKVVMFAIGAATAYAITWFYLAVTGLLASPLLALALSAVPAVAAIVGGILAARFVHSVTVFATAAIAGYLVTAFGWFAYAAAFDIADREGTKGMEMIFLFAPTAGGLIGLIAAGLLGRAPDAEERPA